MEGRFVDGRFVEGRFVEGRFVLVPYFSLIVPLHIVYLINSERLLPHLSLAIMSYL